MKQANKMVSQTSETRNEQNKAEFQENINSQMNWVKLAVVMSAISAVVGVACLLHTILNTSNSTQHDAWQQGSVHRLPVMREAPPSRRLFARRLEDDSTTSSFSDSDDSTGQSEVGILQYLMNRAEYMEAVQLYTHGFESFQYGGSDGHHTEHVDILRKDDFELSEGESLALAAQHTGGNLQVQVLVFCPDTGAETEDCHIVMPNLDTVDGSRRLAATAEIVATSQLSQADLQQMVTVLTLQVQQLMSLLMQQSAQINDLLNVTRTAQEQLSQAQSQLNEAIQNNNNQASVTETHTHHHHHGGGCFARGTMVATAGSSLPIQDAKIGMQLMTSQGLSPFFLQGHSDPDAETSMMQIDTLSNHSVKATFDHYFPLVSGTHMAAQRLSVGDELWVYHEGSMVPSPIVGIQVVAATGLFNPYTVIGDIVVNGILASSHSSWFLEGTGMSDATIVAAYRALFSPLILLHHLKPNAFVCFHEEIGTNDALNEVGASKLVSQAMSCLTRGSSVV